MRFGRRGKLNPMYIRPFKILRTVREVVYKGTFHPFFSTIHLVFHVSIQSKYILSEYHVLSWDSVQLGEKLAFLEECLSILAREVK